MNAIRRSLTSALLTLRGDGALKPIPHLPRRVPHRLRLIGLGAMGELGDGPLSTRVVCVRTGGRVRVQVVRRFTLAGEVRGRAVHAREENLSLSVF
jgi:hypothetical protein